MKELDWHRPIFDRCGREYAALMTNGRPMYDEATMAVAIVSIGGEHVVLWAPKYGGNFTNDEPVVFA